MKKTIASLQAPSTAILLHPIFLLFMRSSFPSPSPSDALPRLATQAKVDKALNGRDSNLFCRDTSSIQDIYFKKMLMELGSGNRFFRQVIVT